MLLVQTDYKSEGLIQKFTTSQKGSCRSLLQVRRAHAEVYYKSEGLMQKFTQVKRAHAEVYYKSEGLMQKFTQVRRAHAEVYKSEGLMGSWAHKIMLPVVTDYTVAPHMHR